MQNLSSTLNYLGYGLAAGVYTILVLLLASSYRGRLRGGLLALASLFTAVWAGVLSWAATAQGLGTFELFLLELMLDAGWILFLSALLAGAIGSNTRFVARFGGLALVAGLLAYGVYSEFSARAGGAASPGGALILGSIVTSLFGLVALEQIYRNAREGQKSGLKFLMLGVGGLFAYDLLLYSNAILAGKISETIWAARGVAVTLCAPLIAVAAQRSPTWSVGIFVSRHVVFYTATLMGAGIYLTAIGVIGYYLREAGGEWGAIAQTVATFAAILGLFTVLFSDRARRNIRVFISKHFFENKYDYREEWLKLINTLTSDEDALPLKKRAVKSLADILDAQCGVLWMRESGSSYFSCVAGWNIAPSEGARSEMTSLVSFLEKTGWVIGVAEYDNDSSHYDGLDLDTTNVGVNNVGYIIPLSHQADLIGFVVLSSDGQGAPLNFEDHDLLKTAGRQIASYLAQDLAIEKLAEARQFDAFNRLTAYLMHDLKNVIAQQSLIVDNAQKHKGNPEFVDDAITTIKGSVRRMRKIIDHLQQRSSEQHSERVELTKVIMQAVSQAADREPAPRTQFVDKQVWVRGDAERLQMAIYHAIRNSQDATPAAGRVEVRLVSLDGKACVEIVDDGSGMDEAFIRERLFKPFDSTKGTQGMGIGAYQIRETVDAFGGELLIDSEPGKGTKIAILLAEVAPGSSTA